MALELLANFSKGALFFVLYFILLLIITAFSATIVYRTRFSLMRALFLTLIETVFSVIAFILFGVSLGLLEWLVG